MHIRLSYLPSFFFLGKERVWKHGHLILADCFRFLSSCFVLWTAFWTWKPDKTVNICIIHENPQKMAAANQRLVRTLRPLPLPLWDLHEGTMSWHFTFHFECSSWGPINQKKPSCGRFIFFGFRSFSDTPQPYAKHFRCSHSLALLLCLSYRCSQRVYILICSTVYVLFISARLGAAGHKLQPIKAESHAYFSSNRENNLITIHTISLICP